VSFLKKKNNPDLKAIVEAGEQSRAVDPVLLKDGVLGTGLVSAIRDTHIAFGPQAFNEPVVEVAMQVTLPDRPPYPVTIQQRVPHLVVGTVVPGASLAVRVDPADTQRVAIDFDHQMDPGGSAPSVGPSL
jgi:hypothetical protein